MDPAPRHQARERAVGLLYEAELKGRTPSEVLDELMMPPDPYAVSLVRAVEGRGAEIDALIGAAAIGWEIDRMAVVDAELRVHGLAGLRVVDASVMPTVASGNTNAATIMIGEKAADMVRGRMAMAA